LRIIASGGAVKTSAVILFPRTLVANAQALGQAGFLNVVLVMCLLVGAYLTWFGYVASDAKPPTRDGGSGHFRSKRSSSITFVHAAMKSVTNFFLASAPA
jgi:hypothetical protein